MPTFSSAKNPVDSIQKDHFGANLAHKSEVSHRIGFSRESLLLVAGVLLIAATHLRFGIGLLAWIAPVPLLVYLRRKKGVAARLMVAAALMIGWSLATLKIITEPLSPVFALFYGVPIGLIQFFFRTGHPHLPGGLFLSAFILVRHIDPRQAGLQHIHHGWVFQVFAAKLSGDKGPLI